MILPSPVVCHAIQERICNSSEQQDKSGPHTEKRESSNSTSWRPLNEYESQCQQSAILAVFGLELQTYEFVTGTRPLFHGSLRPVWRLTVSSIYSNRLLALATRPKGCLVGQMASVQALQPRSLQFQACLGTLHLATSGCFEPTVHFSPAKMTTAIRGNRAKKPLLYLLGS